MSLTQTVQEKSSLKKRILACLIVLRETFNLKNRHIAEQLGVDESYLSNVYAGRASGSTQLMRGLEMLVELTWIHAEQKKMTEIEELRQRLQQLESESATPKKPATAGDIVKQAKKSKGDK
jgi:ribosome-binding protein aMBF1 (putative translation factor)